MLDCESRILYYKYYNNYQALQATFEEAVVVVQDSETKSRIRGVAIQMEVFDYFFGNHLGTLILKHADNFSHC